MNGRNRANVKVHIERLVLDGFDFGPHESFCLQHNVRERLSELVAAHGFHEGIQADTRLRTLVGGVVTGVRGLNTEVFEAELAQSIYASLGTVRTSRPDK